MCVLVCSQVKAVLANILSSVQQQVARSTHSSSSFPAGYDPTLAARWAAANPPGSCGCSSRRNNGNSSSSEQQTAGKAVPDDAQQASAPAVAGAAAHDAAGVQLDAPAGHTLCVHFYSPTTHALLSQVYSRARALLQPTPPAPVEPPKKGKGVCCPTHDTLPACTCSQLAWRGSPASGCLHADTHFCLLLMLLLLMLLLLCVLSVVACLTPSGSIVHPPGASPTKKAAGNNKEATAAGPDVPEPLLLPPTWDPPSIAGGVGLVNAVSLSGGGSAQCSGVESLS